MTDTVVITAGRRIQKENIALAKKIADKWNIPYVFRGTDSIEEIKSRENVSFVIVAKEKGLVLETPDGEFFFHPNLAHLRLKNLRLGKSDYLITALDLTYLSLFLYSKLLYGAFSLPFITGTLLPRFLIALTKGIVYGLITPSVLMKLSVITHNGRR